MCADRDNTQQAALGLEGGQGSASGFVVEASQHDPSTDQGHRPGNRVDRELCATRVQARGCVRELLQRGYWVEVYDGDSQDLLAGPFDPDGPLPAYIV